MTWELLRAGGVGSDALVDDGVLAVGVSWLLPTSTVSMVSSIMCCWHSPVMEALYAEALEALEHVSVVRMVAVDNWCFWGIWVG